MLIILTNVEQVSINMGQPDEERLGEISVEQAKNTWMKDISVSTTCIPSSGLPLSLSKRRRTFRLHHILDKVKDALRGRTGTIIK